ncbi:MAG: domain peptide maturase, grasp-with-spasm system [Bacteroidetes bacterium]|nr:domain peptide maturase, grasp-with-spasm system [Bacteroidota bacterium]
MPYNKHIFRLFAGCILQKGYNSYVICDLQRKRIRRIPKTLYFLLETFKNHSLKQIKDSFRHQHDTTIDEYFNFLHENEFGFFCSRQQSRLFSDIDLSFDHPSIISNAVIDINKQSPFSLAHVLALLDDLHCRHIQLRFTGDYTAKELIGLLKSAESYPHNSIDVIFNYSASISIKEILAIYSFPFVSELRIFNVPEKKIKGLQELSENDPIYFHSGGIAESPSALSIENMQLNIRLFSESQKHHTYFNRKLYITAGGEIKNAPQCPEIFGNVQDQKSLRQIAADAEFQKYWRISKEMTDVCGDCEFRNMCIDSRLPKQRSKGKWYHETECSYNPYISKWKGEEGYRTLEESGVTSSIKGIKINRRKLNALNKELWD